MFDKIYNTGNKLVVSCNKDNECLKFYLLLVHANTSHSPADANKRSDAEQMVSLPIHFTSVASTFQIVSCMWLYWL